MAKEAFAILHSAKRSGVHVFLKDGNLQLKFSKGNDIDPQVLQEIKDNKALIVDFLTSDSWKSLKVEKFENELQSFDRSLVSRIPLSFSHACGLSTNLKAVCNIIFLLSYG